MSPSFITKSAKKCPIFFYGLQNMMSFQKLNLNPLMVDSLIIWYIPLLQFSLLPFLLGEYN